MSLFLILFLLGAVVGYVLRPVISSHKHDYEILFHQPIKSLGVSFQVQTLSNEVTGYEEYDKSKVFVSYKKCRKCNHISLSVSDGTQRKFYCDIPFIQDKIDLILKKEKESADQLLLDTMNRRIAEKEVLTSSEVPYNPGHGNQATPQ